MSVATISGTLALRTNNPPDDGKLAYQLTMEDFEWGNMEDEIRLRALIGVEIDPQGEPISDAVESAEMAFFPQGSILLGNSQLVRALRYNMKRLGIWRLAMGSRELPGLLRGRTAFRAISTAADPLVNQWADEIWRGFGVATEAPKAIWNFGLAREPNQVVRSVQQRFLAVDDGAQVLEEAAKVIRRLIRQNRGVLVIVPTLEGAARFRGDLVRWLQEDGMSEPEARVGLFSSAVAQIDNEKMLKRYMFGGKVRALVGTHMLVEIPDFHVTRAIVWIGLPRQGIDYRNGLVRVYRPGVGRSGTSHAFTMDADGWDFESAAAVIAEKGEQTRREALTMLKTMSLEPRTRASGVAASVMTYNNKRNGTTCDRCARPGHWRADCYSFPRRSRKDAAPASASTAASTTAST